MSEFQNQILFIILMAAGSFMATGTMKISYQNAIGSCMTNVQESK